MVKYKKNREVTMENNMKSIEELMKILQENKLTEISYETEELKIKLKANNYNNTVAKPKSEKKVEIKKEDKNFKEVLSEHVGIYRNVKKDGTPVVQVGQQIKVDDELGNVLAVGVAMPVVSKISGTVEEIYIEDGAPVDYGKALIKVRI